MELKSPKSKGRDHSDRQPAFPIFIQSEIGLPIENWVPVVCTGIHRGASVVVESPAEISALYTMGEFGKGSSSRSKPYIARSDPNLPRFMRQRQYNTRKKWNASNSRIGDKKPPESQAINELHSIFSRMLKQNLITETITKPSADIIDILSSEEEVSNCSPNKSKTDSEGSQYPKHSVVVLPDSDSNEENYFKNLEPKLRKDESKLFEQLILTLEEAFFLSFGLGCLQILDAEKKASSLERIWRSFCNINIQFPINYATYHYFRSKGWIVKPGIKFGGNFLLYKKGQSFYHASYIVIVHQRKENDNTPNMRDWVSVQNLVRLSATAAKEILLVDVIIPEELTVDSLRESPEIIERLVVCETLIRRWTSGQKPETDF